MKRTFSRIFTFMFVSTLGFVNTFSSQGAVTKGKWELSGDTWKFYNEKNEVHKGWVETSSGWYYLDPESGEMKTGWQNINGVEYYFDSAKDGVSGHMHTGWYKSPEGKWYFFNPDQTTGGGMLTGWQWIDGYCYYFDPTPGKESGGMVAGKTTPDGFKINENGQWTDDSGKVQYVAGKGFSSNTSSGSTNTVTDTAKNKEKTASRKGKSSGHSGGGGSSGRSGQSSKPSESEKPKAPQSQEESRPSESEKPKAPQSQKESRPSESEKPKAPEKQEESRPSESKEPKAPEKQEESRPSESEKPKESQSQEESRPSESKSPKAPQSREESGPSESEKPKAPEKQEESRPSESKEPKAPQSREESKPSESKKPKESESQEESRPSESEKETEQNNAALTDGEWYGTATWSRYKLQRGSNVVKVTIKNGKIEKVDSVVYTDDGKIAGSYERKRDYLLEKFKGLEDTKGIKKQLDEGRGEVYDAVSGATETARGHLSAVDNALERSKKFKKDHKEQKIEYIEFAKRPDSVATGQTLDLSKTVLRLHLKGGEVKEITPAEFADYGIVTDPLHGNTLPSLLEFVHVHFKNADSLIDIQSEIQVRKKLGKKYPDKIKISYENGETKDIALNKDEYRYTVEAKGKIKEMSIYSGEEELGKAKYDRDLSQWRFNMKDIPHPGYDEWGYDIYAVIIDVSKDTSDIASFNLETKLIKKNYYVGDSLEIGDLEINAITKNGNNKAFVGWEACKAGRFTSNPDNGYVFTNDDIGEKTIHISKTIDNVSVEKTFTVNVSDPKKQAPAKLEIYAGEKKLTTVNVDFNKFREAQGYLKIFNVEIPKEYENWNKDTFSVKAYNDEGTLLESKVGKKYSVLTVDFKNYRAFHESGGYVWIGFKFVEAVASQSEYVDGEWYGTATWSRYKLQRGSNVVKVTIKNGKIEKVDSVVYTDDGKIAGSYERKRDYLLEKFKGLEDTKGIKKQLDDGRGEVYDAVSGATETARGHLSAVDNALERSKKFKKDHKEQKIEYIEFAKRPDSVATGQTLDLSKTVLKLHLKGGEVKEITPAEFADYGIVTDPLHGSTLPSLLEFVHVHFKNADSLIDIQSEIQVRKKLGKKYPDKIKISYENGETKDIILNKDEYRYTVEAKGKIKEMSIYSGEEELGKAKYDRDLSQWRFNMKDIPHPGYDEWGYDIYAVIIDVSKDTSDIASFNLETKLIKKNYYVGDSLEIGDLEINAVTKNGNNKAFVGWEACKAGGFTSNPDNGYVFTNDDIGEKTIHISKTIDNVSVEKTFTVNVSDPKKQAPAKLEIYAGDKKITTVNVDFNKFREAQGYLKIFNVEIPKEYENWNKDTFSVKAYNDEGTLLESKVGKKYSVLTVDFKNYRAFHESGGYVWIGFKFVETAASQSEYVDGEWYGTATWSRYKLQRGSNVVKVTIKNGKIEKVDSVVYTDDGKIAGSYERKRDYLLEKFKGLEDTKGIKKQLDEGRGEVYDAVSGATETARGHLSAVDNALERSKKFKKDHKEQKIEYIEFAKRPDSVATGQTLDLSKTVLKLHLKGGEVKEITPAEFADYGIVTDPLHGSTLPSLLEFVHVHFKNANSLIDIQSEIQVRKKLGKKYPDKIKISYENGETKDIALNKDEYRYTVEAKGKIKEMSIYSGEEELGKAKYDRDLSQWRFNMKDIPHPGYDEWGYDIYAVIIDVSKDTSDIASFNLETKLIKKNYYVGDSLEIGDLEINAVTKNGNNKAFVGWEACKAGRFTSNPDNGYVFTNDDIGEKTIHISKTIDNVSVEKTFTVNVSDPKKQAPAKLEIYAGDKKITTVNVDFNKFREAQGYLKIFNVEIPKEYENWNKDTFSVKAYNDEGTLLESKVGKKYSVLTVDFKNYRAFHESGGYVWIGFKFVETAKPEQVLPATVELYDKQELIYKKTGITKQEFESSNAHLMLDVTIPKKYENKWDKDTFTVKVLDSKGTQISHSLTKSDNILNIALSDYHSPQFGNGSIGLKFKYEGGESGDGDIKTARGEAQMETFFYKAKVLVTYNEKTGKIIKVQDDGTEPGNANNRNYWNMSVEMFEKLVGKTKDSVDTVDAVTGATLSSNAIKNAVKAALPKEAVPEATNMDVLNLVVDGNKHTYYYKKYDPTNTNMTFMVKGKDVTDKTKLVRNPYVPKVYYYVEDDQKLTGDLYGTADFPYSYFYFGELMRGRITPPSKSNDPQIGQEPVMVQSMSFDGKYTDVSSSTAKNYGKFATAVYSDKKKNSYKIRGVKTPVQIDAELYAKVKLLAAVGAENHSALIPAVTSMTAPDSITGVNREVTQNELPTYKVIHTDSSISELKSSDNAGEIAYNPSDIKVSLTDQSEYGDYQIHIEGLPDEIKVDKNVLGVTFEAGASSNSARIYGLSQLDNILPNGDLGFSVNMRQKGGRLAHKRFEILSGSRIYKITYLLNNYKKFEIDGLELYIPKKLGANAVPSISSQTGFDDENGAKVIFDMSKLPYTGYKVSELYFGTKESGKKLEEGSDYSFEESSNTLTINSTDSTQKGKYTVVFEDNNRTDGYVSTSFTFDVGEASGSGDDSNIVKEVEEEITRFGYYAALRVTINKKTGTVVNVEDNDTNAGANRGFWANALNMLPRFVGKKASEIDTVDGISGATVSSDAIKKAVKKAFAEQSGFRMANRDMSMQPRLATDSNAEKPLERKKADGENDRNDLTIPSYHTERKVIMKNKVGELYDPKKLIF